MLPLIHGKLFLCGIIVKFDTVNIPVAVGSINSADRISPCRNHGAYGSIDHSHGCNFFSEIGSRGAIFRGNSLSPGGINTSILETEKIDNASSRCRIGFEALPEPSPYKPNASRSVSGLQAKPPHEGGAQGKSEIPVVFHRALCQIRIRTRRGIIRCGIVTFRLFVKEPFEGRAIAKLCSRTALFFPCPVQQGLNGIAFFFIGQERIELSRFRIHRSSIFYSPEKLGFCGIRNFQGTHAISAVAEAP